MTKVAVIGIDAATSDLIERWKNHLPNLKRIMDDGAYGVLRSTTPPDSSPAWICFYTGKNPGKIGVYGFVNVGSDGTTRVVDSTACDSLSIWEILSQFGKRVCILNVPLTYPPKEINGYMVAGYPSPFSKNDYTYPSYLHKELQKVVGGYQTDVIYTSPEDAGEEVFLDELSKFHNKIVIAAKHLLRKEDWDFFMVVFREIDYVQHHFWKYMGVKCRYANTIRDWYIKIDETVGEIMDELNDDVHVMIMSDHGCQAARYAIYMNEWLKKQGLLSFLTGEHDESMPLLIRLRKIILRYLSPYIVTKLLKIVPHHLLKKATLRGVIKQNIDQIFSDIDWSRTKVYALGGTNAALYVNLKGRGPNGIINPGKEYEGLRTHIMEGLRKFSQVGTINKIFVDIKKKEEIYWGTHADVAPDLAIDFFVNDSKCFVSSATGHGKILNEIGIHGTHSSSGIWLITGPEVKKNTRLDASIVDLAPTILYLLGIPIPEDMDGKILRQGFKTTRDPKYQKPLISNVISQSHISDREQKELKERLRALGYLG